MLHSEKPLPDGITHNDEIARLIHSRYESKLPLEFFLFEAHQTIPLVRPDLVDVGYMSTGRWKHIAEVYAEIGMLPRGFDFKGFLYEPVRDDLNGLRTYLGAALGVIGLITLVAAYIHHINRRLHRSVAETRRAAERLEASEEKYRLLTETMKDVVWTVDTDTLRFIYISPSVERLRGYTPEEIAGTSIEDMFRPEDMDVVRSILRQRVEAFLDDPAGAPCFYTDEAELPCKDGSSVWVEMVTTYCRNLRTGRIELHGVEALDQADAQRLELRAHRRVDVGVAAGHAVPGLAGDGGNAAHEGAADAEDVDVHGEDGAFASALWRRHQTGCVATGGQLARRLCMPAQSWPGARRTGSTMVAASNMSRAVHSERGLSRASVSTWRTAWPRLASACSSATRASAGSSWTSGDPAFTKSVSSARMAVTVPPICGVIWITLPCT